MSIFKTKIRDICARQLASWMRRFAFDPRYFDLWQANGYHVTQLGFYSPLPDTRELSEDIWTRRTAMAGLDLNPPGQLELLANVEKKFRREYETLPHRKPDGPPRYFFGNQSFESVDAEMLYCLIRLHRPRRIIEIGSGFTTLLATQALARNREEGAPGAMTAIEPYPPAFLREALPEPVDLIVQKVQDVPLAEFKKLREGDFLFIDSSHVCKIGSDVQYEFLEILPVLAPGVIVHVHDVFMPADYPACWIKESHRFWNEQYLLQAFLCCNRDFVTLWAASWMQVNHPDKLAAAFPAYVPNKTWPASFWMQRR